MAAEVLQVTTEEIWFVAAHGWDVAGAVAAGCRAAFIARPGREQFPLAPKIDITGSDLTVVAAAMIELG